MKKAIDARMDCAGVAPGGGPVHAKPPVSAKMQKTKMIRNAPEDVVETVGLDRTMRKSTDRIIMFAIRDRQGEQRSLVLSFRVPES